MGSREGIDADRENGQLRARDVPDARLRPHRVRHRNKGKNVLRLLQLMIQLHKQAGVRISTGDLNRAVRAAIEANARNAK